MEEKKEETKGGNQKAKLEKHLQELLEEIKRVVPRQE